MNLEFVCHASVILHSGEVTLLTDPWLTGTCFDSGWGLLSEPVIDRERFQTITHIWISHEHPDHFSPRSLGLIPPEARADIIVLFHQSADRKVATYCQKMGFKDVVELTPGAWLELGHDFTIRCDIWEDSDDSWLLVKAEGKTLMNLNDCQANTTEQLLDLAATAGPVDILLTQYSISGWDGNTEEEQRRLRGAQAMIDRSCEQARILGVEYVVPFASFIWFCHEENVYMNSALRPPRDVASAIDQRTGARAVVLYPGDLWEVGSEHDSRSALERYDTDLASLPQRELYKSEPVELVELRASARRFADLLLKGRSRLRLALGSRAFNARAQSQRVARHGRVIQLLAAVREVLRFRARPSRIWLSDHHRAVEFDLINGLRAAGFGLEECDLEVGSSALHFAFRFLWGGETLQVNGRFREVYPEGRRSLFRHLGMATGLNRAEGAEPRPL
jgi:hypothetical protein